MKGICAVIVTYNPDQRLLINCNRLKKQVDLTIIVNNGPLNHIINDIIKHNSPQLKIICLDENIGLAAALNVGISYSQKYYQWVITFDQDSIITNSFVKYLIETYDHYPNKDSLAIVAPIYKDQTTGMLQSFSGQHLDKNQLYAHSMVTITSGNMIASKIFEKVGLFREDFFIDYIDFEFCLRCQKYGYKIIESTKACLLHNVGTPRQYKFLWKTPLASNHNALRRYYITRNRIVVYKLYFNRYPLWVLNDIYIMLKEAIKILIYEKNSMSKYCWMLKGVRDALLNKMGPLNPQITDD
jgi:rhamnosyltransferase